MHALAALWQNPRGRLVVIGVGLIALFIAIRYAAQRGIGATSPIALPGTDTTGTTDGTTGGTTTGGTTSGGTTDGSTAGSTDGGAFSSPYLPYVPGGPGGVFVPTGPGVNLTGSQASSSGTVLTPGTFTRTYQGPPRTFGDSIPGDALFGGLFGNNATTQAAALGATGSNPTVQAGLLGGVLPALGNALGGLGFNAGLNSGTQQHEFLRALNPYGPRGAAQATAAGAGPSAGGYSTIGQNQLAHRGVAVAPASSFQAVAPPHPNVSFAGLYRTAGLDV